MLVPNALLCIDLPNVIQLLLVELHRHLEDREAPAMQLEHARTTIDTSIIEKDITPPSQDVATKLVDMVIAGDITPEEERSALRRIDYVLMPAMFVSFALQYMDKACLTGAALFGILTDLDLVKL